MSQPPCRRPAYAFDDFPEDDAVWEVVMYGAVDSTPVAWMGEVLLADWRWRFREGSQLFGVSAFGTDLGLRIMEGLGLVAVT